MLITFLETLKHNGTEVEKFVKIVAFQMIEFLSLTFPFCNISNLISFFCLDVAQGRTNGAPIETRTQSYWLAFDCGGYSIVLWGRFPICFDHKPSSQNSPALSNTKVFDSSFLEDITRNGYFTVAVFLSWTVTIRSFTEWVDQN